MGPLVLPRGAPRKKRLLLRPLPRKGGTRLQSLCKCEAEPQAKHFRGVENPGVDCFDETALTSSGSELVCPWRRTSIRCKVCPTGYRSE